MTEQGLRRRYVVISAVHWLAMGLVVPVLVLLLEARGLPIATVGLLVVVHAVVIGLLELPTGGLADSWSRHGVLVLSVCLTLGGLLLLGLGVRLTPLAGGVVLLGAGRALQSGPLEAWYVDGVRSIHAAADVTPGLAAATRAELFGLSLGTMLGGFLPGRFALPSAGDALVLSLSTPFIAAAAVLIVEVGLIWALLFGTDPTKNPNTVSSQNAGPGLAPIRTGLSLVRQNRPVQLVLLRFAFVGAAATSFEVLVPVRLDELIGSPDAASSTYATIATAAFLLSAFAAGLAPQVRRLARGPGRGALAATVAAGVAGLLTGSPTTAVLAVSYASTIVLSGPARPLLASILHDVTGSDTRATLVSLISIAAFIGSAIGGGLFPFVAQSTTTTLALVLSACTFILGGLILAALPEAQHPGRAPT